MESVAPLGRLPQVCAPQDDAQRKAASKTGTDGAGRLFPRLFFLPAEESRRVPSSAADIPLGEAAAGLVGTHGRTRTYDLMIKSHLLYRLSYVGVRRRKRAGILAARGTGARLAESAGPSEQHRRNGLTEQGRLNSAD